MAALESFLRLTTRTLKVAPATHPGLLTDLMWLAASANDLGENALARELNAYALAGRTAAARSWLAPVGRVRPMPLIAGAL